MQYKYTLISINNTNYLMHHGIKGQKWGIRRYQNSDGTLTPAGRERYGLSAGRYTISQQKQDRTLYGKGAVKRVAKRLGQGETLVSARHHEAKRKYNNLALGSAAANAAGSAGGSLLGSIGFSKIMGIPINSKKLAAIAAFSGGISFAETMYKKQINNPYR